MTLHVEKFQLSQHLSTEEIWNVSTWHIFSSRAPVTNIRYAYNVCFTFICPEIRREKKCHICNNYVPFYWWPTVKGFLCKICISRFQDLDFWTFSQLIAHQCPFQFLWRGSSFPFRKCILLVLKDPLKSVTHVQISEERNHKKRKVCVFTNRGLR